MQDKRLKRLGIIGFVSKQAGTLVGTTAACGKKGAGFGTRGVTAVVDLFRRPVKCQALITEKESRITAKESDFEQSVEHATAQENNPSVSVAMLESDRVAVQHDLMGPGIEPGKSQSQLESQLEDIRAKKESLVSDLKKSHDETSKITTRKNTAQAQMAALEYELTVTRRKLEKLRSQEKKINSEILPETGSVKTQPGTALPIHKKDKVIVEPINNEVALSMEAPATQTDEDINVSIAEQKLLSPTAQAEASNPPDVTLEQVCSAVFSSTVEKIIFTKALSEIASKDVAARINAARVLAGIHHELSIKSLVARISREPSPKVRQECIRALATLKAKEEIPAVERALADHDASVRLSAVWGLYHLAGAESAPMLVHMFSDDNEDVRRRAATCIGWLGQKELAPELLSLLADSSVSVRRSAVEAIGNLHSRQVVWNLIERLNDPDESIKKAILVALETITGKKMCKSFPTNNKLYLRLIARWREWWKDEQSK